VKRALILVFLLASCDRGEPPPLVQLPPKPPASVRPLRFVVAPFEGAPTVDRRLDRHAPVVEDLPCEATGKAWPEAEAATEAALRRYLRTRDGRHDKLVVDVLHQTSPSWSDGYRRGSHVVEIGLRVTATAGYASWTHGRRFHDDPAWQDGPIGTDTFCLSVTRHGDEVRIAPRLVSRSDF
jgi:hypothetical protein